jgi:hypothetical protein
MYGIAEKKYQITIRNKVSYPEELKLWRYNRREIV